MLGSRRHRLAAESPPWRSPRRTQVASHPRPDHRSDGPAARPPASEQRKFSQYIGREIAPGLTDTDFLLAFTSDEYRADSNNAGRPASVLLKGDTQSGKTMLVEVLAIVWAERLGLPKPMPIFTISGSSGVTDFDLFGQTTSYTDPVTGVETLVWLPGMVELGGAGRRHPVPGRGQRARPPRHVVAAPADRPPAHVRQPQQGRVQRAASSWLRSRRRRSTCGSSAR